MSQILSHQRLGWVSPPYSSIQMLMKYTLGAQSYAGPEVEGAHFLRKRLVILPGYGQTLCTLSLCQELLVEAAHDCAQPKDIQQDFTPDAPRCQPLCHICSWSLRAQRDHEKAV